MFTHEILSELSELELSIYNCILRHRENIGRMKIKELADEAHVSTATVLRFCRKMGCEGYAEFKLRYKEHLEKRKNHTGRYRRDRVPGVSAAYGFQRFSGKH